MTRSRHPLMGRRLQVIGAMRRLGRNELLVVLPDGSKTLIPAAWTDREVTAVNGNQALDQGTAILAGPVELLHARELVARLRGSHRARRTTVQPAQLSLMPEQIPAPPLEVIVSLPETGVAVAIRILARLIASAAATTMAGVGDE